MNAFFELLFWFMMMPVIGFLLKMWWSFGVWAYKNTMSKACVMRK